MDFNNRKAVTKAGVNQLFLVEWSIDESTYGKQLKLVFSPTQEPNAEGKQVKFNAYLSFKGLFTSDNAMILHLESRYKSLLQAFLGVDEGESAYNQVTDVMQEAAAKITGEDADESRDFEEKFVIEVFKHIKDFSVKIPVVLHYVRAKTGSEYYLNVAKVCKEFDWKNTIGYGAKVHPKMLLDKPESPVYAPSKDSETEDEAEEGTNSFEPDSGESDLPF